MKLSNKILNDESSDEDSNIVYIHIYECYKCGYTTRNNDPDCSVCHKKMCMLAKEIKINYDDDENEDEDEDEDEDKNKDDKNKNNTSNEPTICSEDCACDMHR